ncbi:hypothetical protein SAMN02745165_03279 [Malonomonas rubra DSM 5091]|uniref:DUF432 domain-containing protein n=1 Tax=Malonomonas rubra DSM 5091 TaxID=1122189 RepID=A0A1M6MH19_MALRU|nr:hypothetical protein [Malonomonas rubra]SHJ82747.1 hypothetical protein SAMN02745165_03279 [Malonomonas rubra DSM 5091]
MATPDNIMQTANWWGGFQLAVNDSLSWSIGHFSLQILRREKEWVVWHNKTTDPVSNDDSWRVEASQELNLEEGEVQRHIFSSTENQFSVYPKLADRPVIVKTAKPLHIQTKQQIDIYVSSPLWFTVTAHKSRIDLQEVPIVRPSDTWFGPSTLSGELCYASTTQGRLYLSDLPQRPHRAISPVRIKNQAEKPLLLTQFSLPTPYLSLFDTEDGGLWTEAVTLLNDDDTDMAKVSFSESPPAPYAKAKKITKAREKKDRNMLLNTFSTLFS